MGARPMGSHPSPPPAGPIRSRPEVDGCARGQPLGGDLDGPGCNRATRFLGFGSATGLEGLEVGGVRVDQAPLAIQRERLKGQRKGREVRQKGGHGPGSLFVERPDQGGGGEQVRKDADLEERGFVVHCCEESRDRLPGGSAADSSSERLSRRDGRWVDRQPWSRMRSRIEHRGNRNLVSILRDSGQHVFAEE